jgi:hypothetical protein
MNREQKWGKIFTLYGYDNKEQRTLEDYKYVSDNVENTVRNVNLPFAHHKAVAPLEQEQQKEWLSKACGKWLAENKANFDKGAAQTRSQDVTALKLSDLGVTKNESSRLQKIAENNMNIRINIIKPSRMVAQRLIVQPGAS